MTKVHELDNKSRLPKIVNKAKNHVQTLKNNLEAIKLRAQKVGKEFQGPETRFKLSFFRVKDLSSRLQLSFSFTTKHIIKTLKTQGRHGMMVKNEQRFSSGNNFTYLQYFSEGLREMIGRVLGLIIPDLAFLKIMKY